MKPVNLNKVRKARAKEDRAARGDENAVKFGRTKGEKQRDQSAEDARVTRLEAHKRET